MNLREALTAALEHFPVVTHVPGYGATEVFQPLGRPHSYHEEAAWTVAHGAALAGTRAAALFKAHGFLKAANSLSTTLTAGTTAALIGLVFEDPAARHSDNVLQGAPVLRALGYEVFSDLEQAVAYSEQRGLPAMVEIDDLEAAAGPVQFPEGPPAYRPEPGAHLVCPMLADQQFQRLQARRQGREPEPIRLPGWGERRLDRYRPFMEALASTGPGWVSGDTGLPTLFGLEPYRLVEATSYLGGSLPLAVGAYLAGRRPAWAVTGDFSFLAAGHLGLVEARLRQVPLKVALFWNGQAAVTGGQRVDRGLLEAVLAGHPHRFVTGDPAPELARAAASDQLEILVCDVQDSFRNDP